jgi:hypothetical protein
MTTIEDVQTVLDAYNSHQDTRYKYALILQTEKEELESDSFLLECLHNEGVDDWIGYGEALATSEEG